MKVKVLNTFADRHTGAIYRPGDCLTISKARYKEILTVGPFVEEVKAEEKEEKAEAASE